MPWGYVSGGYLSGGECPGGICPGVSDRTPKVEKEGRANGLPFFFCTFCQAISFGNVLQSSTITLMPNCDGKLLINQS